MQSAVLVLNADAARAQALVCELKTVSANALVVRSLQELQQVAAELGIRLGVVDLDVVTLQEIAALQGRLSMEIVCTHHTADESMWADVMNAGALDCCYDDDVAAICRALTHAKAA
jgi:hypothetical protein